MSFRINSKDVWWWRNDFNQVLKVLPNGTENGFTQGDAGWDGSAIDPEGNPGQHDHERGWEIRLQQEEEDVTPQCEVDVQPVVPA